MPPCLAPGAHTPVRCLPLSARVPRVVRLHCVVRLRMQYINEHHENPIYLPGIQLGANVKATSDLIEAVGKQRLVPREQRCTSSGGAEPG